MEKNQQLDSLFTFDSHPYVLDSFHEKDEVYCKGNYVLTSLNIACKQVQNVNWSR